MAKDRLHALLRDPIDRSIATSLSPVGSPAGLTEIYLRLGLGLRPISGISLEDGQTVFLRLHAA